MDADTTDADAEADDEALPAFLADDDDGVREDGTEVPAVIAAE